MNALRLLRGLIALAILGGMLAGIPAALWALGSPFLLDHVPSLDEVVATLSRPDDGSLLLGLLVIVGWLVWLQLAASIIIEAVDRARSLPAVSAHHWGFRSSRTLAALLIGWVLTMFASPATASTALPVASVTSSTPFPGPTPSAAPPASDGPIHVVLPRDTLWDIAERTLGDALRWREILHLNQGRAQADGERLADGSVLHVGWELLLPLDAQVPRRVPVEPGDTLSALAATHLGDPQRYADLYDVNVGRPQADGRALHDPDLIRPGWLLTIPEPNGHPERRTPLDTAPDSPDQAPAEDPVRAPDPTSPPRPAPSTAPAPPPPIPVPQPEPAPHAASPEHPDAGPAVLIVSGLAASGVLATLALYRRRQLRWRRTGRQIALPDLALSRLEATTRSGAQTAGTRFLDLVLRALAMSGLRDRYPPLTAAWLAPTGVDLVLAQPHEPPPPFTAEDDGAVWHVDADTSLRITEQDAVGVANPYPALTSIGTGDDGSTLLVDLEHLGAVHLVGDRHRAVDLLRNMAVELGTSRWADGTLLLVVGLEAGLTDLAPSRGEHIADVHTAARILRSSMAVTGEHLARADSDSVVAMRVRDQLSDSWVVTVLLVADPDSAQLDLLAELCAELADGERRSAAIVTAGTMAELPGTQISLQPDGSVRVPHLDTGTLRAEQMSAELADGLRSVLGTALGPDQPPPPAPEPTNWAREMLIDGSLRPEPIIDLNDRGEDATHYADDQIDLLDPEPATPDDHHNPSTTPDPAAHGRLLLVEQQDPDLGADLAAWQAAARPHRPLIAILGEPDMRAPGEPPSKRRGWYLEVAVYLALHPSGVDRDKLTTDLWPEGSTVQPPTIRRAVAEARAWAGKDTTDDPPTDFIPSISPAGGDRYRITGHLTDWDLFRRLRKRAHARAAAGRRDAATADYRAALSLVRGPVLQPLRQNGYAWLHNPDQRHEHSIPGFVIDTAHELVDLALAADDIELARFAAETARLVDPDRTFDRPFTDLMRIAHAAGDHAEMRQHAQLLLAERGFEVGEELPPESFAVFNELFPHGLHIRSEGSA